MRTPDKKPIAMTKGTRALALLAFGAVLLALASPAGFGQKASDPPFKVKLDFDRWHDIPELYADFQKLQTAYPKFLKFQSIGKSYEGRTSWS